MANCWMVRAGRGGMYSEDFEKGYVAVGWAKLGDLSQYDTDESLRERYLEKYGNEKPSATANGIAIILKFRDHIKAGDYLVSYNPETRKYLIGYDKGEYLHDPNLIGSYPNLRTVDWIGKVGRDELSQKSRNSLGSTLTLFSIKPVVLDEFIAVLERKSKEALEPKEEVETEGAIQLQWHW